MSKNAGRKALPAASEVADVGDPIKNSLSAQAADLVAATERQALEAAEVYRLVGRIETAQFMETVSGRVMAETYLKAKALIGDKGRILIKNKAGNPEHVSGMEEFCAAVMPVSARRCRQIIAAIDTLGTSLYEQAERIGFRSRDYQALRALPDDQQQAVKLAIETGDLETAVEVLHDLAAQLTAAQGKLQDGEKNAKAKDRVIAKRDETIRLLQEAEERRHSSDPIEREQQQIDDLRTAGLEAEMAIRRLIRVASEVDGDPATEAAKLNAAQAVHFVFTVAQQEVRETGIQVSFEETVRPSWFVPAAALCGEAPDTH